MRICVVYIFPQTSTQYDIWRQRFLFNRFLIFYITIFVENLCLIYSICGFQLILWSTGTSKNVVTYNLSFSKFPYLHQKLLFHFHLWQTAVGFCVLLKCLSNWQKIYGVVTSFSPCTSQILSLLVLISVRTHGRGYYRALRRRASLCARVLLAVRICMEIICILSGSRQEGR